MALETFFNGKEDWKEFLSDEAKQRFMTVLDTTRPYRGAYFRADDIKTAQLWCALIEAVRRIELLESRLGSVEAPLQAIVSIGEAEKRKAIEKIISEIIKPVDLESQEATKKIVESLRRF